ncbi:hypothetical protein A1D18_00075 [Candidatus Rickettsiella isopodorum]|jgi:hypothetical protein|uniref:SseB protein N-terminal domain-containing protein n=1 Tax=Candidatus Rickettsiella isopodorum TaxID=1225476 RepID=A0A1J8NNN0_9COXI|nr:hypothetical protein [Candidatus Rickettsiella isopodorum]OIZ96728.1 hypothetical protein A1D18_00075 [Candidatus Rickettsiella isopodorum]
MKSPESNLPTTIEQLILGAKNKEISLKVVIQVMMDNNFFIACSEKALTDKEIILPLCTEFHGEKTACVFTKKEWAEVYMTADICVVKLKALEWLKKHPANYGLIVNPSQDACIKFSASGIQNILKEFI